MTEPDFDAVVVGASVAGCTAARLYAQRGARVALVERRPDIDAYKTVCTHYIQPSATPTIEKLGLAPLIEEHGAVRNSIDLWTPYGGWIRHRGDAPYGYNVTRAGARSAPAAHDRRDAGRRAALRLDGDRAAGERRRPGAAWSSRIASTRAARCVRALVVAADGRDTHVARMAGVRGRVRPHNRFFYWAYWRGVQPADDRSRMWFMEPDCAYSFPNENGLCLLLAAPHRDRLPEFRSRPRGRVPALPRRAARRPGPQPRHARVQAAGQARPAERQPAGRATRPGLRGRRRARLRSALGRRLRVGVPERGLARRGDGRRARRRRRPRRGARLLPPVHRRRLGPHHFLISDIATRAPRQPGRARDVPQRGERRRRLPHVRGRSGHAADRRRRCSRRAPWRAWRPPEQASATRGSSAAGGWRPCPPRAPRSARGTRSPTSARSRRRTS